MCIYPKADNTFSSNLLREGRDHKQNMEALMKCSVLLELSAFDDLDSFVKQVEEKGLSADEAGFWYGRGVGSRKMGIEERTPLMIASMYGSLKIVQYIIGTGKVDVNRACGSDGVTALHCAAAGGSYLALEVTKCLIGASANINSVDAKGNKPVDLIAPGLKTARFSKRKLLEMLLKGISLTGDEIDREVEQQVITPRLSSEKKEYPVDISLPDINDGVYGTDEFRMYSFKVKPCSRAYSHDWTECPFVHPGENARRRDPRKYPYTCVPCPEFRKGSCRQGDACEYAHGVFESWLHPAQYKTRLCKDEVGCARKVCFFAHKPEELRPVYASTGSAMPSPKSLSSSMDMGALSPLPHGSLSSMMPQTSTPPMSPAAATPSPKSGNLWQNKLNLTPPMLQLPGSRLKTASSARDLEFEMEMLGLENQHRQQQQYLMDEITRLSSPTSWNKQQSRFGDLNPTNLDDSFGSLDMSLLSQMQGISSQIQSPTGLQMRQSLNQHGNYPNNYCSSPVRKQAPSFGFDSSAAVAAAVMKSRTSAFAKRSQSFVDRSVGNNRGGLNGSGHSMNMTASNISDWNSPSGRLDWGMQGEDLNKLRKSASFGIRSSNNNNNMAQTTLAPSTFDEPDVSWVNSLVKDAPTLGSEYCNSPGKQSQYLRSDETLPAWMEQMYIEQEQMVA
uniref:C3H1-type domain-containing protein n=1 Tax=Kalanchoe fedtschenkoi TaxID=63787 RepID=A0A7N1A105_KALFE